LNEPVILAAFRDCIARPAHTDSAICVAGNISNDWVWVVHAAARTLCVRDDTSFVVTVCTARGVESDRDWCCWESRHYISNTSSFSHPACDLSFWNEKSTRSWISSSFASICFWYIRISRCRICAPVFLEVPKIVLEATVASAVSVRFSKNSSVGTCVAGAVNTLWLGNSYGGAIWLYGKCALKSGVCSETIAWATGSLVFYWSSFSSLDMVKRSGDNGSASAWARSYSGEWILFWLTISVDSSGCKRSELLIRHVRGEIVSSLGTFSCDIDVTVNIIDDNVGLTELSLTRSHFRNSTVGFVELGHVVSVLGFFLGSSFSVICSVNPQCVGNCAQGGKCE